MTKNRLSNQFVLWCVGLLFMGLAFPACGSELPGTFATPPASAPQEGYKAPDFQLQTPDGNLVALSSYSGKPVIVNFWATWCPPCRAEMPDMQRIYEDYRREGLIILGINNQESGNVVKEFSDEFGLTFPLLLDSNGKVSELYLVRNFPTTLFIDSNGVINSIQIGSMDYERFQLEIQRAFNLAKAPEPPTISEPTEVIQDRMITGCVTANALNVRTGPSTEHDVFTTIPKGECHRFDARDSSSSWVRLHDLIGHDGKRLWVSTIYVETETPDEIKTLPVR